MRDKADKDKVDIHDDIQDMEDIRDTPVMGADKQDTADSGDTLDTGEQRRGRSCSRSRLRRSTDLRRGNTGPVPYKKSNTNKR